MTSRRRGICRHNDDKFGACMDGTAIWLVPANTRSALSFLEIFLAISNDIVFVKVLQNYW